MKFKSPPLPARLLLGSLLLILNACATMTGSSARTDLPAPVTFCMIAKPFYWSARDTDQTITQAREWNAAGKALCGWGTKSPDAGSAPVAALPPT